jgi:hypothetical protein
MGETKISFLDRVKDQLRTDIEPGRDFFEKHEVYENEILTGIKWQISKYGHIKLDEHCPYKQGQLTTIIGHTNVGKTTLIIYLLSRLLVDKKLIIYSAENRISQIARMIIGFVFGHENYKAHFQWLRERVMFIRHAKQFTYKDMLEQIAISEDIGFNSNMIFIDPYNALKVEKNRNSHEYHYEASEDMRIFTMTSG